MASFFNQVAARVRDLFGARGSASAPPFVPLTSQRQANQKHFDGAAGSPYKVRPGLTRVTGTPRKAIPTPRVGKPFAGKLNASRSFNATNDDHAYLVPLGRPAAGFTGASNGAKVGGLTLNGRKIKDVRTIDLSTARTDVPIAMRGSVIIYADSTLGTDRLNIRFATSDGDVSGPSVPFRPGQYVGGENYSSVLITNAAIAGSTATLIFAEDTPEDPFTYR